MTRTLLLILTAVALPVFLSSTAEAQVVVAPGPVIVHRHYHHHHYWYHHRYWHHHYWHHHYYHGY